jgi:hypothetical protein
MISIETISGVMVRGHEGEWQRGVNNSSMMYCPKLYKWHSVPHIAQL